MNETKPERGLASKGIEVYPNYTGSTAKCLNYATQIGDLTKGEREELDATCYDDDVEHSITGIRKKADAFEVTFLYNARTPHRIIGCWQLWRTPVCPYPLWLSCRTAPSLTTLVCPA